MKFKGRNLNAIAEFIVGDKGHFPYRSSSYITEFFEECDLEFVHDGTTRRYWLVDRLEELLNETASIKAKLLCYSWLRSNKNPRASQFKSLLEMISYA